MIIFSKMAVPVNEFNWIFVCASQRVDVKDEEPTYSRVNASGRLKGGPGDLSYTFGCHQCIKMQEVESFGQ
jgi:hypothetical protein